MLRCLGGEEIFDGVSEMAGLIFGWMVMRGWGFFGWVGWVGWEFFFSWGYGFWEGGVGMVVV